MRSPCVMLLLMLLSACSADKSAGADPVPRVKPRLVNIELPPVVHRERVRGADGSEQWSVPDPIDGAETCVIERRDAYAVVQPWEPLDPPICVTTAAGDYVELSGIPANSDLTITVQKEGYLPTVLSQRVEADDVPMPAILRSVYFIPLFDMAQAGLFVSPEAQAAGGLSNGSQGGLVFELYMAVYYPHAPFPEGATLIDYGAGNLAASDAQLTATEEQQGARSTFDVEGQAPLLELPTGTYRAKVQQAHTYCEPWGYTFGYNLFGLSTDAPEELELRIMPGHVTLGNAVCTCLPSSTNAALVDPNSCTLDAGSTGSTGEASDAGQ